eukprot:2914521-Karenia_brevis.AAC.1
MSMMLHCIEELRDPNKFVLLSAQDSLVACLDDMILVDWVAKTNETTKYLVEMFAYMARCGFQYNKRSNLSLPERWNTTQYWDDMFANIGYLFCSAATSIW